MASNKVTIEYGFVSAKIAPQDSESTMSKVSFHARVESEYPSASGWEVYQADSILVRTPYNGLEVELPYVTYFLKKVNG